ncbi:hypothetical protein MKW94_002438 [Papaver nudicaule]|uniref:CCAAT-binding factor domain-containing protein n=1 Tax=Papaver nudicaule TaxID=74823 RepID=A0AA41SHC7_PAPNU|nr:hypothetical protein [Papaver nudicaule]
MPKKVKETVDEEAIKSDVASFLSSAGFAPSATAANPGSGFDDSDFRKTGTIKNPQNPDTKKKKEKKKVQNPKTSNEETKKPQKEENFEKGKKQQNPKKGFNEENKKPQNGKFEKKKYENNNKNERFVKEKVTPVSIDNSKPHNNKWKNLPKLPCIRATSLRNWYEDAADLEVKVLGNEGKKVEVKNAVEWKNLVAKKREIGERLMAQFTEDFEASKGSSGDIKMLLATQRSGTAVDKVSAFSVLVGENPIANIRSLDALLAMITSKVGKRHALTGFEALKELFLSSLLPDRKLKILPQRPLNHLSETKDGNSLLLFWYWEECLKQRYERFVIALDEASRDMLPVLKEKALKTIYALLRSKSEQERRLLSGLVNKLGDPENKGASNADYHLSNLLTEHPNMKAVVIDEVDSFLFRPHLAPRSKYHAVNFLCQIRLTHKGDGAKVAKRLVDVYFALFKLLISEGTADKKLDKGNKKEDKKEKGSLKNNTDESPGSGSNVEMDSRLLSALLTGVNRAFPFVASDEADDVIEVQTPMLFKLVHSKNFNVGVQALLLLEKISSKNQIVSDRFYRALYSKLLLPAAMNSSKAEMFIGLLLRAMKSDVNLKRVSAFSKRIMQVALQQPPQFACGCLFLLSEVLKARPPLWNMVLQNESVDDDDIEHFEDIVEGTENESKPAVVKQPEQAVIVVPNNNDGVKSDPDSSDSEEVELSGSDLESEDSDGDDMLKRGSNTVGPLKTDGSSGRTQPPNDKLSLPGGYDPRHREPSYCNADRASWWELTVLASHAHPSVATMARTLLSGANIVYNGNPLSDLSLPAFLDKFMEKKPKSSTWHGGSQIEPAKKLGTNNLLVGAEILSLAEDDVAPEDLVFHKFYTNKMMSSKKPKKKKKKAAEDEATDFFGIDKVDGDGSEDEIGGEDDGGEDEIGGDESDNEEIDNLLDSGDLPLDEAAGDYDYDDLDQVAEEDDEDLIGGSGDDDAEMDILSDVADEDDDNDVPVNIGDSDGDINEEEDAMLHNKRKRNRKGGRKAGASPFASIDDYDHLLKDENEPSKDPSTKAKKKSSSRKKRKQSD